MANMAQRTTKLQCTRQGGQGWASDGSDTVPVTFTLLMFTAP
jgi:hypothetical protein